ncbi:hypothetical protein [Clostridiisalibacter paucivorans]|uniref:hypothetical protein n=1 Tax=Clostridiisalibacter paucivorans TaxID=408753 RepID=UPI00047EB84E|nr:hypothetical protein [Clostridiisalibacter paucivorans]
MKIKYNITISPRTKKNEYCVEIDRYPYLEELWQELDSKGYIDKLKNIPQLGNIKIPKRLKKVVMIM